METIPLPPLAWLATFVFATAFNIIFPIVLAVVLTRRFQQSFKFVIYGALIFMLFQLLTRVPLVIVGGQLLAPYLQQSIALQWAWVGFLSLTAGLVEEIGRYTGYRWLMRNDARTWEQGVLYGVGHGGFEAAVLIGLLGGVIGLVNIIVLTQLDPSWLGLNIEQQQLAAQQLGALADQPWWFPLLAAWERGWAIAFHTAMSVVVLQVFWRNQIRWLWYAVAAHTGLNFGVAGVLPLLGVGPIWMEGAMALFGLASLWIIFALRQPPVSPDQIDAAAHMP